MQRYLQNTCSKSIIETLEKTQSSLKVGNKNTKTTPSAQYLCFPNQLQVNTTSPPSVFITDLEHVKLARIVLLTALSNKFQRDGFLLNV